MHQILNQEIKHHLSNLSGLKHCASPPCVQIQAMTGPSCQSPRCKAAGSQKSFSLVTLKCSNSKLPIYLWDYYTAATAKSLQSWLLHYIHIILRASLVAQLVKNLTAMQKSPVRFLGLGRSLEEGKSFPLQYSGLENSMDYIVHGVTKSQTQNRATFTHSHNLNNLKYLCVFTIDTYLTPTYLLLILFQ